MAPIRSHFKLVIIAALMAWATVFSPLHAQTGTIDRWIRPTGGNQAWNTGGFWFGGNVPQSSGDIANITADIVGNQVIVLGGTQTVGTINLGDLSSNQTYTIGQLATTDLVSFDNQFWGGVFNLGGRAALNKVQGGADVIADVQLVSDLAIYTRTAFTMAGVITDGGNAKSLLKMGSANLTLSGANSYTGDTIIHSTGGTVLLNTTGFNSISSPLIRLGNSTYEGSAQTFMTLQQSNQIADASVIRFDGAGGREAFFRLNGFNETIAGISDYTSNGVIENVNGSNASMLTLDMGATDSSYNGYLRNGGAASLAVTKNGTGTLALAGGRISFTGGMTVNDGALQLSNLGNNVFGSDVTLVSPTSALEFNATADYIFTKAVSGSGSVSKTGVSTVTWTQNNSATGAMSVQNGTLRLSGANAGVSSASVINLKENGTLLISNRTGGSLTSGATNSGSATITVADTANLAVGMSVSGPNIPAGVVITSIAANGTQFNISANATATATGQTFSAAAANMTDRIGNAIPLNSTGGGLRFDNGGGASASYSETVGTLTLSGGTTTITTGRVGAAADPLASMLTLSGLTRTGNTVLNFVNAGGAAIGSGNSNKIVFTGGLTLDDGIVGGWATVGNEWATYGGNGVAALSSYSQVIGGKAASWSAGNTVLTLTGDTSNLAIGMLVTGSGGIQAGTTISAILNSTQIQLSLPANNTGNTPTFYSAGAPNASQNIKVTGGNATYWLPTNTTINSLNIQHTAASTFALNGKEILIGTGGILANGADHTLGSNNASAGVIKVGTSVGHAPGFNELIINVGDSSSRTLTLNAQIADNGANPMTLIKSGPGRLVLTPFVTNNNYSGGTTVLGGTLEVKSLANLGTNSNTNYLVLDGGGIELAPNAQITIPVAGTRQITIGLNGGRFELDDTTLPGNPPETLNIDVPVTGPGRLTLGGGDATGGIINMNGVLSNQGGIAITIGTLALNNPANTFSGGISISGGDLKIPAAGSLPSVLDLTMAGGTFNIVDGGPGGSVTIGALSGSSNLATITTSTSSPNPPADLPTTLIIDQNTNTTYAGKIQDIFSNIGEKSRLSLIKAGTGILTLSADNSFYRGTTTIVGGSIAVTKLAMYSAGNSSIGFGDFTITPNSADGLVMLAGTSLIYVGSTPSITDRSFTIGTGSEAGAIYANGTVAGASLQFMEYNLGPGDPANERVQFSTADVGATLTLGGRNTGNNIFGLNLSDNYDTNFYDLTTGPTSPTRGYVSLVKTGPGTWVLNNLNGSNSYSGSTTIYEGRLVITGDGALGQKGDEGPPVQLVGGVLDLRNVNYTATAGKTEDLLLAGGRLDTSSGTSSWAGKIEILANTVPNVNVGRNAQLTLGAIDGAGALDKDNFGTLVLTGVNTYTGSTRIRDGSLTLDYTSTPGDNKLSNTATLAFGGGRTGGILTILGNSAGTNETVGNTVLDRGEHQIVRGDSGDAMIDLKAITPNTGGQLDVEEDGLALTITNNNAPLALGGILGDWATVGRTTWAYKDANNGLTGVIRGLTNAQYTVDTWGGVVTNTDAVNTFTVPAGSTTNTLRFNQATPPVTVTLSGLNTINSGGILVTPIVNSVHQILGGSLTAGAAAGNEIVVQQFSPTAGFVIGSEITNRGVTAVGVQKLGPGMMALTGTNTYTGITTVGGGTLLVNSLADGGLPSSIGQSTFAAANLVLGGGTLEYSGDTTTINRGLTVKEFGALNVGDEDTTLTLTGDATTAGIGNVVGDAGTAEWTKNGAGTLRLLRLEASGGASGIQTLNISDGKLILENGYSTTPSTPAVPAPPNATDRLINTNANLTVSGGKLEFIGDNYVFNNGGSFQRFFSQFSVGAGASEIQVTSQTGLNPLLVQTTTLGIGDPNNAQEIIREVAGTVLFIENPNGGQVVLNLNTVGQDMGKVLPWATYWNKFNTAQPGVNNFAAIEQADSTVVSADSKSLYATKSNPANWNNDGRENISEEGGSPFGGATVALNSQISTLRFFNDNGAGIIKLTDLIQTSNTLTLTNGAILIGANVKNNQKTLTGGTLTSTYLPADGQAELIIHNYNPMLDFRLESVIANPLSLVTLPPLNLVHTGNGTTALFGANTYTGTTFLTGGVLKLENANALPGGISASGGLSALTIDGGVIGLTAASGDFNRGLGAGGDQVQWTSSGGFAAYGVDRNVNLGGNVVPSQVIWGLGGFVPSGDTLVLGAADADKSVTFQNPISLGVTDRLVRVENGSAAEDAVLAGTMTGAGSLTKNGEGSLRLTGSNSHLGGVNLAEGTLIIPSAAALGSGALSVGVTGNTTANDAPTLVLEGGAIPNVVAIGNKNSAGVTSVEIPNDVTLNGPMILNKNGVFVGPDTTKVLNVNGAVGGTGGLTLVDGGKIVLSGSNTYGSSAGGAGIAINGSAIVRNGTIELRSSTALGDGTKAVELGDAMFTPVNVDRATTGISLLQFQGAFEATGNGIPGSVNGIGAFYDVSATLDGVTYTAGDAGKIILVKDEIENPERNGVYKIVFSVGQTAGTMNLTRVDTGGFPLTPDYITYGTGISIQNGTLNAGKNFFLGAKVDASDINVDGFYWKNEASLNPNVALLIGSSLASPIANPIDVNATNGTGTTTIELSSAVMHGSATLSGDITLQSQLVTAETKDLFLTSNNCAELILSGAVTDPDALDKLNLIKTGTGTVTLSGANNYAGFTEVRAGVLKLNNATALGGGNLNINGGVVGLTTASGNFSRTLGTGASQVQWAAGTSGGFAAYGTNQSATVNSGAALTWGTTPQFLTTGNLVLGSSDATAKVTFTNPIAFGTAARTVNVPNGPAAIEGELSGVLSGGAGGTLNKTGQGTLLLSGINTHTAGTNLVQGTLQGKRTTSGSVFGSGASALINVGTTIDTQTGDALKLEFIGDTEASPVTYTVPAVNGIIIGNFNSAATSSIEATNGNAAATVVDVDVLGTVSLGRRTFVGPDSDAILQFSAAVSGANGSITVVDGGTVRLNAANSYGSGLVAPSGAAIDGATIIRDGTIELSSATATLGSGTVELGDARTNLAVVVDRASGGMALSDCGAVFSLGTYSGVPVDFGGGSYTVADIGKNLLVKDETGNPARNGIYEISAVSGADMTLVRVAQFDVPSEMVYGTTVQVANGLVPNQNYFMSAPTVATVNTSPVLWREVSANPNVALLARVTGTTVANNIDLNATVSTGTTTLGAVSTLTDLGLSPVAFAGTITMQSQNAGAENLTLDISSAAITNTATGITFSGLISVNAVGADTLNVRKTGNGVATLSNATGNTYNGTTNVNAGILLVNNTTGSGTGTGTVTVNGVGTVLGGTGSISGLTTINSGAILQPGTGVSDANASFDSATESLAFTGGLTLGAGSSALFQLNGALQGSAATGYDFVSVLGAGTTLTVDVLAAIKISLGYSPAANQVFNILDWTNLSYSGADLADQLNFVNSNPLDWDTSQFATFGQLTYLAPEPSRVMLLLLGALAGLFRRRRSPSAMSKLS